MLTIDTLEVGQIITNKDIVEVFEVNTQGGMRRSLKNNCLILTCKHLKEKKMYDDRWEENILHYVGMGLKNDSQKFQRGNKTLRDSLDLGIRVFLFEVFKKDEYTYSGEVFLYDSPYHEIQYNYQEKCDREVIVFPLRKISENDSMDKISELKEISAEKIRKEKTLPELIEIYKEKTAMEKELKRKSVQNTTYNRDPLLRTISLKKAQGYCQLCDSKAPFKNRDGEDYLESHHIIPLSQGGEDSIENVIALCPNCHRKMHVLGLEEDIKKLKKNHSPSKFL